MPDADDIFALLKFLRRIPSKSGGATSDASLVDAFAKAIASHHFDVPLEGLTWESNAEVLVADPMQLQGADMDTCVKLLTLHLSKDRACNGHLRRMMDCGHLFQLLLRLQKLVTSGVPLKGEAAVKYDEFCDIVTALVPELLDKPGSALYSTPWTLRRGKMLIVGTNPGGSADDPWVMTLRDHLDFKRRNTEHHSFAANGTSSSSVLKKRLTKLMLACEQDIRHVCAINLMFTPSVRASEAGYPKAAERCWPVIEWVNRTRATEGDSGLRPQWPIAVSVHSQMRAYRGTPGR